MVILLIISCGENETAHDILNKTIESIDTIRTISYKQDMIRTDPGQTDDTIYRYREMYFKRLIQDSIVGVKGHWYFYGDDKTRVNSEDIYDGNRLIRKNNLDSTVMLYNLIKFPEFKTKNFWGHNTLYAMQYSFRYILDHLDSYEVSRLNDTLFMNKACFQMVIRLENKKTMPGFATKLEKSEGNVSRNLFFIDKETYYPLRMIGESFSIENPQQKFFIDQTYFDIRFNLDIDDQIQFNTSDEQLTGYRVKEIKP